MPARELTPKEWREAGAPARNRVFASDDPYEEPFLAEVGSRALLFPMGYAHSGRELDAIRAAAAALGETTCYLQLYLFGEDEWPYWQLDLADADPYAGIPFVHENSLFSRDGAWGLLVSDENHAVVAGDETFVETLVSGLDPPDLDAHALAFLAHYVELRASVGRRYEWLPVLLAHLYGDERAAALIERAGWSSGS
jgi:hypothetical protein